MEGGAELSGTEPRQGHTGEEESLRIRDRIPVEIQPLAPEWTAEVEAGRLGAAASDRAAEDNRLYASVDELLRTFPRDQLPEGPLPEALRLLDSKLDYLIRLVDEDRKHQGQDLPPSRPVAIGLDGLSVEMPGEPGSAPEAGSWVWAWCALPGRPPVIFEAPARVSGVTPGAGESEAGYRLDLAFANVTEAEERVLSGYIFRRHREAIRLSREGGRRGE